jgi:hypothetical protein
MNTPKRENRYFFPKSIPLQFAIYASLVIFMSNLDSLVDLLFHPEISYWDDEHLVVGGVTGIISFVIFGYFLLYVRNLHAAMDEIKTLQAIVPICSNCKKIRKPGSDPSMQGSWQEIEPYIMENTSSRLSHGVCPECFAALYPDVTIRE